MGSARINGVDYSRVVKDDETALACASKIYQNSSITSANVKAIKLGELLGFLEENITLTTDKTRREVRELMDAVID